MPNTHDKQPETAPQGKERHDEGGGEESRGPLRRALGFLRALAHAVGEVSKQFPHFTY